jgi:hypothetical protein
MTVVTRQEPIDYRNNYAGAAQKSVRGILKYKTQIFSEQDIALGIKVKSPQ